MLSICISCFCPQRLAHALSSEALKDPHDMHKVDFFGDAFEQQFCSSTPSQRGSELASAGDPGEHIFVISLPRRLARANNLRMRAGWPTA